MWTESTAFRRVVWFVRFLTVLAPWGTIVPVFVLLAQVLLVEDVHRCCVHWANTTCYGWCALIEEQAALALEQPPFDVRTALYFSNILLELLALVYLAAWISRRLRRWLLSKSFLSPLLTALTVIIIVGHVYGTWLTLLVVSTLRQLHCPNERPFWTEYLTSNTAVFMTMANTIGASVALLIDLLHNTPESWAETKLDAGTRAYRRTAEDVPTALPPIGETTRQRRPHRANSDVTDDSHPGRSLLEPPRHSDEEEEDVVVST
jgi:hypothetical protein